MTTETMKEWAFALLAGGLAGFLFGKLKLPVPAPPTIAGILGIVGIAVGYYLGRPR